MSIFRICKILQRHTLHLTQSAIYISKIFWTYLHLRLFDWIISVFPTAPVHSFRIVLTIEVQTIQVGEVTTVVPPGAFITRSTVAAVLLIITILGGKKHTAMITKRITSCSYKKKKRKVKYRTYFSLLSIFSEIFCNGRVISPST